MNSITPPALCLSFVLLFLNFAGEQFFRFLRFLPAAPHSTRVRHRLMEFGIRIPDAAPFGETFFDVGEQSFRRKRGNGLPLGNPALALPGLRCRRLVLFTRILTMTLTMSIRHACLPAGDAVYPD